MDDVKWFKYLHETNETQANIIEKALPFIVFFFSAGLVLLSILIHGNPYDLYQLFDTNIIYINYFLIGVIWINYLIRIQLAYCFRFLPLLIITTSLLYNPEIIFWIWNIAF